MPLMLFGVMVAYAAAFSWGVWDGFSWLRYQQSDIGALALVMLLTPACSAWAGAELVQALSPRRAFDRRVRARGLRFFAGLCAGLFGLGAGAALLPIVDRFVPDALTMGATSAIAAAAFVLLLKRQRRGHCISCGYDQRGMPGPGQPGAGICPECGTPVHAGVQTLRA
jgi:hypothetical protein